MHKRILPILILCKCDSERAADLNGQLCRVEYPQRADEIAGILRSRRLKGRVHGKLGQTDIDGIERHLRVGNVAEGRAAAHIGAVVEMLDRYIRLLADRFKQCCGNGVCRVTLACVVLDDDAAVHFGLV